MAKSKKPQTNDLGWVEVDPAEYKELKAKEKALSMKNLEMPESFKDIPYAQRAWCYIFSLGIEFNERQYESIRSYCLAVAMRDKATEAFAADGMQMMIEENGVLKQHPMLRAIREWNAQISQIGKDLGIVTKKAAEKKPKKNKNEDMFS